MGEKITIQLPTQRSSNCTPPLFRVYIQTNINLGHAIFSTTPLPLSVVHLHRQKYSPSNFRNRHLISGNFLSGYFTCNRWICLATSCFSFSNLSRSCSSVVKPGTTHLSRRRNSSNMLRRSHGPNRGSSANSNSPS